MCQGPWESTEALPPTLPTCRLQLAASALAAVLSKAKQRPCFSVSNPGSRHRTGGFTGERGRMGLLFLPGRGDGCVQTKQE